MGNYHYLNGHNQVCETFLIRQEPIAAFTAPRIGYILHPDSLHLFTQFHDYDVDNDPTYTLSFNNIYQLAGHIHQHSQRNANGDSHYAVLIKLKLAENP